MIAPRSNARAYAFARGVRLPPRGSAQDRILEEIHTRERAERFSFATLFARIVGQGLGVRNDVLESMLNTYRDDLTEFSYTPAYNDYLRNKKTKAATKKVKKTLNDAALLKRLERLSSSEDVPPVGNAKNRGK